LIDNADLEKELLDFYKGKFPSIRYIRTGSNLNFGGGNNLGIEIALKEGAEYIVLVNPDTWFEPNWLKPLLQAFNIFPDIGILSPFQLCYENQEPALWSVSNILKGKSIHSIQNMDIIELPFTEGSCMVIRRKVLEKVGSFDPLFEMYYEEIDLCRRARRAGFRIGVVLTAQYHHYGSGTETNPSKRKKRDLQIDKSQWLSIVTHPEHTWFRNQFIALRWLLRRTRQWTTGQRPYYRDLLKFVWQEYRYSYSRLYHKWKRDRGSN